MKTKKRRVLFRFREYLRRVPRNDYNTWVKRVDQLETILNDEKFSKSHSNFLSECEETFKKMDIHIDPLYCEQQMKTLLEKYSMWTLLTPP